MLRSMLTLPLGLILTLTLSLNLALTLALTADPNQASRSRSGAESSPTTTRRPALAVRSTSSPSSTRPEASHRPRHWWTRWRLENVVFGGFSTARH